jgi:hypothetical protein
MEVETMVTVTCQHTGVEFEARSKAARNHPRVTEALSRVTKSWGARRAYRLLMESLEQLRADGRKPTLEEFDRLCDDAIEAGKSEQHASIAAYRESRRAYARSLMPGARVPQDEEDADFASQPFLSHMDDDSRYEG